MKIRKYFAIIAAFIAGGISVGLNILPQVPEAAARSYN